MKQCWLLFALIVFGLVGCTGLQPASQVGIGLPPSGASTPESATGTPLPEPTQTSAPLPSATSSALPSPVAQTTHLPSPTPERTLSPDEWQALPVIPGIHPSMIDVFHLSQELGNDPGAFSKIGDCGSTPAWFLGDFDRGPRFYRLGEHTYLEPVIQAFQGSFERTSLAAKAGFNAASVFSPLWSDPEDCQPEETPLACEYRVHKPSFAFIMLGSNDVWHQDSFEAQMRQIIEYSLTHGVIPILSTKADNLEKDGSLNLTIARLAQEYHVPLLNYWSAVQSLPKQGLQEDKVHITWAPNRFDDPQAMRAGWPVRNLTSLQMLDAAWRSVVVAEQE